MRRTSSRGRAGGTFPVKRIAHLRDKRPRVTMRYDAPWNDVTYARGLPPTSLAGAGRRAVTSFSSRRSPDVRQTITRLRRASREYFSARKTAGPGEFLRRVAAAAVVAAVSFSRRYRDTVDGPGARLGSVLYPVRSSTEGRGGTTELIFDGSPVARKPRIPTGRRCVIVS